ncbi:MAG: hypothetical protein ABJN69_01490 [Hellea sp.]
MKKETETPDLSSVNYDALLNDVLGLNLMGLKSLWIAFKNPKRYFHASSFLDWQNTFTPAFRLWFTLVAVTFFFQFFWAGTSSSTLQMAISQIEANSTLPKGVSAETAAREFLKWSFGFLPLSLASCLFLLAAIYPFWGEKLNFAVRQRRLFIAVIPGTFLAIFSTVALGTAPLKFFLPLIILTYGLSFILDALTAYRGAFEVDSKAGRLGRAVGLGVATFLTSLSAGILANIGAMAAIAFKYG